jgi:tRNA-splicing ligase RtcB
MKLTVLDLPTKALDSQHNRLVRAIETETRFGMGAHFDAGKRRDHEVMDEDWNVTALTRSLKDKAHAQLGTSGSGNHFVEFGQLSVDGPGASAMGLPQAGAYLALLSHSGSRGPGSTVATHYSRLAMNLHPQLPRPLQHLAWLDLDADEGQGYWHAMQLMGRYAAANHAMIHRHIARHLGARVLADVENHHNFAWPESHDGREVIVHRKGATPADLGAVGIIPGSMASPAYVVRGRGSAASMHSASHGAGRVMSRRQARLTYRWSAVRDLLKQRGVHLISAGLDEVPFVYKDIDTVMSHQRDLVETVARFDPKLVKMAPDGEKPED